MALVGLSGCAEVFGDSSGPCASAGDKTWRRAAGTWSVPGRVEHYESSEQVLQSAAPATALLVTDADLKTTGDGSFEFAGGAKKTTCCAKNSECRPYGGQRAFGRCTGFLVGGRTLVTAAHCEERVSCESMRAVFGAHFESPMDSITPIPEANVYSCSEVLTRKRNQIFDYAVLRLDRDIEGRSPLELRESGTISPGERVGLVGGPGGAPLKLSVDGRVSDHDFEEAFLVEKLKATTGDSGAPILNLATGEVEGLHVGEHPELELTAALRIGCIRGEIPGYSNSEDCNRDRY